MVEDERRLHQQAFDALLAPYASQGLRLNKHMVKGQPTTVIKELTARSRIDILVMGAGAKTGNAGWLLGSSAERMLKVVPCSVVASIRQGRVDWRDGAQIWTHEHLPVTSRESEPHWHGM